jgi:hypothetical protein
LEQRPRALGKHLNFVGGRQFAAREHCRRQLRPIFAELIHRLPRRRLHDVMDVDRLRAGVGEEPCVNLLGREKSIDRRRGPPQQWPELCRLLLGQFGDTSYV